MWRTTPGQDWRRWLGDWILPWFWWWLGHTMDIVSQSLSIPKMGVYSNWYKWMSIAILARNNSLNGNAGSLQATLVFASSCLLTCFHLLFSNPFSIVRAAPWTHPPPHMSWPNLWYLHQLPWTYMDFGKMSRMVKWIWKPSAAIRSGSTSATN